LEALRVNSAADDLRGQEVALVVNTNIASMNAQRSLTHSARELSSAMERLSTGKKINSAADDAAGFAIAETMTSQVRGLTMGVKNANDAISFLSVVDNATQEITDILQRINELGVQGSNGTNNIEDQAFLQLEVSALTDEIDRIANKTMFNGERIFGPNYDSHRLIQVGTDDGDTITVSTFDTDTTGFWGNVAGELLYSDWPNIIGPSGSPPPSDVSDTDFMITSGSGSAIIDIVSGDSALQVAQKINASYAGTGVFAGAYNYAHLLTTAVEERTLSLNINGVSTGNFVWSWNGDPAEEAINKISGETGVRAYSVDGGVRINTFGEDIKIEIENSIVGDAFEIFSGPYSSDGPLSSDPGNDSATIIGELYLNSEDPFTVERIGANAPEFFDKDAWALEGSVSLNDVSPLTSYVDQLWHTLRYVNLTHSPELVSKIAQNAIDTLSGQRAGYGASLNRLDYVVSNLLNVIENTAAARSRIQDADFAVESARLAKAQVLQQSVTAMLSQANAATSLVLSLLEVA